MIDINTKYNNIEEPNEFILLSESQDLCDECENNLIQCPTCNGYFDLSTFYDQHEFKCVKFYTIYKEKENVIDCKNCHYFVKYQDLQRHKDFCRPDQTQQRVECQYCQKLVNILLLDDHQLTCEKIQSEMYMVKESIECSFCNEKIGLYYIESHEEKCIKLKENKDLLKNKLQAVEFEYPKRWGKEIFNTDMIEDNLSVIQLDKSGEQHKFVVDKMLSTVRNANISNVYRIENKYLWEKYAREKERIKQEKGRSPEHWLFHGTRSNDPKGLYNIGFDISFSSDFGACGRGIYFARQAIYSHTSFAFTKNGKGYIFLAKVITGKPFIAGMYNQYKKKNIVNINQFRKPPLLNESKFIYYDSVTDIANKDNKNISQMYVIYENNKAYPYYLIEYDYNGPYNYGSNLIRPPLLLNPGVNFQYRNNIPAYDDDEEISD
jgi:hypothetical protein